MTLAARVTSNVDWWHGQSKCLVCCSYKATAHPICEQIFEKAMMPSWVQDKRSASRLNSSGRKRISRTASLAISESLRWAPGAISGSVCATAPTSRSSGRIGRSPGSVTKRVPAFQDVFVNESPGSGPRSRSKISGESPASPSESPRDRLISERRPKPAAAAPSFAVRTKSARSSSGERNSCR